MNGIGKTIVLLFLASVIIISLQAQAYTTYWCGEEEIKWSSDNVGFEAASISFPAESVARDALQNSINLWNRNPSRFDYSLRSGEIIGRGNGQNEIWFSLDESLFDIEESSGLAAGVTMTWWDCIDIDVNVFESFFHWNYSALVETDVIFNAHLEWTYGTSRDNMTSYGGSRIPFEEVTLHELGHAQGLDHSSAEYNLMYPYCCDYFQTNGGNARSYPGEDASDGSVHLYGLNPQPREDVAVAHWEGSPPRFTKLSSAEEGLLAGYVMEGEAEDYFLGGVAKNGEEIRLQLTYENNGTSGQLVDVGFYLSTNDLITTGDTRIGGTSLFLTRDNVYTRSDLIQLPDNLTPATLYYIGAIVDENNEISETYENNNATYLPLLILEARMEEPKKEPKKGPSEFGVE